MSIDSNHELMKDSFLESKDVINKIFDKISAPEEWYIKHMTFDELLVALYRLLGIFDGTSLEEVTVTPETMIKDVTAYNHKLEMVIGNIETIHGNTYMPTDKDQLIINANLYTDGDHIILGDTNLKPENIKHGVSIFNVVGTYDAGGANYPDVPKATAKSKDIIEDLYAYENDLTKIIGTLKDRSGQTVPGDIAGMAKSNKDNEYYIYVSPQERAVLDEDSRLKIKIKIDPNTILLGTSILGVEGKHVCSCPIPTITQVPTHIPTTLLPTNTNDPPTPTVIPTVTPAITMLPPTTYPTATDPTIIPTGIPTTTPTSSPTITPTGIPTTTPDTPTTDTASPLPPNTTDYYISPTPSDPPPIKGKKKPYTYICIDPDLLKNDVETRTHTFSSVVEQYLDEKWHNEDDPMKDRTLIDAGHTYMDQRPLNNLYYYKIKAKKLGNIVKVGFSDFHDDLDGAESFNSYQYEFDLTDERLQDSFTDKFKIGIQVDNLESAKFMFKAKVYKPAPTDGDGEYKDGRFGEHVNIVYGALDPVDPSSVVADSPEDHYHDGERLRCPIAGTYGSKDAETDHDIYHKININIAKQFLMKAKLKDYTQVTVFSSNNTCKFWDSETWSTRKVFSVDDEAGLVAYLNEAADQLGDNDPVQNTEESDTNADFLIIKGKIAHGQKWRDWQADVCDWNACPTGYVKWTTYPDRIDQTEGHNELNYYVSKNIPFEYDWEINVVIYDIRVTMMEVAGKEEMKYGQGRAGLIITTLNGGYYSSETEPPTDPDEPPKPGYNTHIDIPSPPNVTIDPPTKDLDDPTWEEPTSEDPTWDDPTWEEPTSDEPTSDEPTSDEPTEDYPTSEPPTPDTTTPDEDNEEYTGGYHDDWDPNDNYWPWPVLQWKYSDYLAPRYYPYVRIPTVESYARPYPVYRDVPWDDVGDLKNADPENVRIIQYPGQLYSQMSIPSGWTLVCIKSARDQEIVEELLASVANSSPDGGYLIGLTGVGDVESGVIRKWSLSDNVPSGFKPNQRATLEETGFSNWGEGEPNNSGGEQYVEIFANGNRGYGYSNNMFGKWNDEHDCIGNGIIIERVNNQSREKIPRITKVFDHWEEYIQNNKMRAIIWLFARVAYTQEFRSTLYHYGHNGYVNLTKVHKDLYDNIDHIVDYYEKQGQRQTKFPTGNFGEFSWSPYYRRLPSEMYQTWQKVFEEKYADEWPSLMEYKAMWGTINTK